MEQNQIEQLERFSEEHNLPGAGSEKIRQEIIQILCSDEKVGQKRTEIGLSVLEALLIRGKFFYDLTRNDFKSGMFFDGPRKILWEIASDPFRGWLSQWLGLNKRDEAFQFVIHAIESEALSGPHTTGIIPEGFFAAREGAIYISNGDGQMVKIVAGNYKLVDNGTDNVLFRAGKTLAPWKLTTPVNPFEACRLFRNMTFDVPHGKELFQAFVLSMPTNPKSKPPLACIGLIRSGKTRASIGITELFGLPLNIVKPLENREEDIWIGMHQGGLLIIDNADTHTKWLPDALAAAATNAGTSRRKLWNDDAQVKLLPRAWVVVTSANPSFASDAGLADRLLVLRLQPHTHDTADAELSEEIACCRDGAMTFVSQTLATALADTKPVAEALNARHPDFGRFGVRIGRALGREQQFIDALRLAETDKARVCIENDPLGVAILQLLEKGPIKGTAGQIHTMLAVDDSFYRQKVGPRYVSSRLANLWPHLQSVFNADKRVITGGALQYTIAKRE